MESYAYQKLLYKTGRERFQKPGMPKGIIDPLIAEDIDDLQNDDGEDLMFWHLKDVWRWLIKFDNALSRCRSLTSREKELCLMRFEKSRTTNPLAGVYAHKFIQYLLVNKWAVAGGDQPETIIGLIQVLVLIISNMAFDDASYKKLARVGIPIKGFPYYSALLLLKESDGAYAYYLEKMRKSKSKIGKFDFTYRTNQIFEKIFENFPERVKKYSDDDNKEDAIPNVGKMDAVIEDDKFNKGKAYNITDLDKTLIALLDDQDWVDSITNDLSDKEKTKLASDGIDTKNPAHPVYVSALELIADAIGIHYVSFDRVKDEGTTEKKDKDQKALKDVGKVLYIKIGSKNLAVSYSWNNHMDLFTKTMITHFEPSYLRTLLEDESESDDGISDKAFNRLIKLMVLSNVKSKGIPNLKKLVELQKEITGGYDKYDKYDKNKYKKYVKGGEPWPAYKKTSYKKKKSTSRRKAKGGRKKYGRKRSTRSSRSTR